MGDRAQVAVMLGVMVALFAGLGFLVSGRETVHWGVVVGVAFASVFFFRSPHAVLRRYRVKPLDEEHREVRTVVETLAKKAALDEPPDVTVTTRDGCDAFSVATPRRATIVLGRELLEGFSKRHIEAVLAHEVSHIAHHDTVVMGFADLIVRMTRTMSQLGLVLLLANGVLGLVFENEMPWGFVLALVVAPFVARTVFASLGRTRERRADEEAAKLTGDPEALAEALELLERAPKPKKGLLRALNPYGIAPAPSNMRNHPPTAVRIERLRTSAHGAAAR